MEPPTQSAASADGLIGTILGGKYLIEYRIARGGSGDVYRAIQQPIHRPVAVKVMRRDLSASEQETFEERFLTEASQMGSLQHPNIVTVHDFGRAKDGTCFIVMELLEGETLKDALRGGPMTLETGLDVSLQLARGLRHAHRAGMIHRDIKAGNAMVVLDGDGRFQAKLLDFGLVKSSDEVSVTSPGVFTGTPHYVSPEQARGMRADFRSDIYSLGVLMYRIFTGRLPYYSRNPMSIAIAHIQEPFPAMCRRAPEVDVPEAIEAVVRRCMAKEPSERYPDAGALYEALSDLSQQLTPTLSPVETLSMSVPRPAPRRTRPGLLLAGLLGGVAVLGSVAVVSLSGAPEAPQVAPVVEVVSQPLVAPPEAREVPVLISSQPAGATVLLGELDIGTTPYAGKLRLEADEPTSQPLRLELAGYQAAESVLDLSGETAAAHVVLQAVPQAAPARKKAPAPTGPDVTADGVRFTAAEAAAAVAFLNTASESQLRAAGIAGRQVTIILDSRPFASIQAFAETYYIGEKTVEAVRHAAR